MKDWDTVAIIGVGLIGGSLGLELKSRTLCRRVVGIGRRKQTIDLATRLGLVDDATTDLSAGVKDADLVVVCTPVEQIVPIVKQAADACQRGALITDAGSTKHKIVAALSGDLPNKVRFIGSHPMAGSEQAGPDAAREGLFENRTVVVTPPGNVSELDAGVERVCEFWRSVGASVRMMDAREHDETVAVVSHLPHVIASALAGMTDETMLPLAATGWLDTTRIASGDVELWQQIMAQNAEPILRALGSFATVLDSVREAVSTSDEEAIRSFLELGKRKRDLMAN